MRNLSSVLLISFLFFSCSLTEEAIQETKCNHEDKSTITTIRDTIYVKISDKKEIEKLKKKITLMKMNLEIEKAKNGN